MLPRHVRTGRLIPQISADAVEVIDDLSVLDGQFADELLVAIETFVQHVGEAELAFFKPQNRDIRD